jgi:hypothetical protein
MRREDMDHLIHNTIRQSVTEQEPSAGVRDSLLAKAAAHNVHAEPVVGPSIPPLVNGLREARLPTSSVRLPEFEMELMDIFGSAQQHLVSVWLLTSSARY